MTNILKNQMGPALRVLAFLFAAILLYTGIVTLFGSHVPLQQGVVTTAGQPYEDEGLFWGRPAGWSVTEKDGKLMLVSQSAALDPDSPAYTKATEERKARLTAADPDHRTDVPKDLWTASASGMDPDISWQGALWQIPRLEAATGKSEAKLKQIIESASSTSLFGTRTVNVQKANLALQQAE